MNIKDVGYRFRAPYFRPEERGGTPPLYRRSIEHGMIIERDVPVKMRDGVTLYVDLFRPVDPNPVPPLISWGPYGKHITTAQTLTAYPMCGVDFDQLSPYTMFEAPDPLYWVPRGYAIVTVDIRGTWYSEGQATYLSPMEAEDFYDLIEWAGTQPWSNGRVGLSGVSYLTIAQWRVAALNPPHLAAINPWEGYSDPYRDAVRHGGIPETSAWPYIHRRWGVSTTSIEDLATETEEHPFYDAFWQSKVPDFSRITVPAYVVASWSDHGLHTRGTLEGFKRIRSRQKWLEVHGQKKWAYYYHPESVKRQQEFFDHFLKGKETSIHSWPKVRLEVRERVGVGTMRAEKEWPIARTRYTRLYLDAQTGTLQHEPVTQMAMTGYYALGGEGEPSRAQFDFTFDQTTELIGHMKLKVYMAAEGADDMDLFVAIQKLDATGQIVPFIHYAQFEDGPVALGWLRASHRELDPEQSTEYQPVLAHRRELKLSEDEIVPLEIEIWPSGTRFEAGEKLRLIIQGSDIYQYPRELVYARHEDTVNKGRHLIYTGGPYDSYLLVPVVPSENN